MRFGLVASRGSGYQRCRKIPLEEGKGSDTRLFVQYSTVSLAYRPRVGSSSPSFQAFVFAPSPLDSKASASNTSTSTHGGRIVEVRFAWYKECAEERACALQRGATCTYTGLLRHPSTRWACRVPAGDILILHPSFRVSLPNSTTPSRTSSSCSDEYQLSVHEVQADGRSLHVLVVRLRLLLERVRGGWAVAVLNEGEPAERDSECSLDLAWASILGCSLDLPDGMTDSA